MTELEKNNIELVNYEDIVFSVQPNFIDYIPDPHDEDLCRLKLHYITKELCDTIIYTTGSKPIVVYRENGQDAWVLEMISRYLPLRICKFKDAEPERSFLNRLIIERDKPVRGTFEKIKQFTKINGLTWLNEKYFNQLKTKQLLFK